MNDTEMSQQERDAELIAKYRERMYTDKDGVMMFEFDPPDVHEPVEVDESDAAMLRTIDALTAERDRLRADNERLRAACEGVPEYMEYEINDTIEGGAGSIEREWIEQQREWITRIRAALAAPAGDGAVGDGERGSVQS